MNTVSMVFTRWVIRHKPTGKLMPQSSRKKHGYTHDEPVPMENSNWCPRLFSREQDAKTALTWWLKGETTARLHRYEDAYNGGYEWDEDWHTDKVAERRAEDMEVAEITLKVSL